MLRSNFPSESLFGKFFGKHSTQLMRITFFSDTVVSRLCAPPFEMRNKREHKNALQQIWENNILFPLRQIHIRLWKMNGNFICCFFSFFHRILSPQFYRTLSDCKQCVAFMVFFFIVLHSIHITLWEFHVLSRKYWSRQIDNKRTKIKF